jgi:hypothetical protein
MNRAIKIAAAAALGCASPAVSHPADEASARIEQEIATQIRLWNGGDLEAVLQSYCPSAEISWVNGSGLSHGFERFARSMREEFGREPGAMGVLAIELLETRDLGDGGSLAVVRWSITRDGARLMGGISSQLWAECQGRRRVVFEHAS